MELESVAFVQPADENLVHPVGPRQQAGKDPATAVAQGEDVPAPVLRVTVAHDEAAPLEAVADVRDRRAVEGEVLAEGALVDAGVRLEEIERAELHGRVVGGGLLLPDGGVQLLGSPEEEPGVRGEVGGGHHSHRGASGTEVAPSAATPVVPRPVAHRPSAAAVPRSTRPAFVIPGGRAPVLKPPGSEIE